MDSYNNYGIGTLYYGATVAQMSNDTNLINNMYKNEPVLGLIFMF